MRGAGNSSVRPMPACRGSSDGERGGGGEKPDPVPECQEDLECLHTGLFPPQSPDPQSFIYYGEEKSHADEKDRSHGTAVHPGKGDGVSLSFESERQKKQTFTIPYNRQQLADYLAVDRSALSAELSRMKKDGLIRFEKNCFQL